MSSLAPKLIKFAAAGDAALALEMRRDERVFVMATILPSQLHEEFGPERVRVMPISEALMTGMAVGAAADGMRPVVLWRNVTFGFVAFDQVANQAAKLRYMSGGQRAFPIVFRCAGGGGFRMAAQHSQSPYSIFAHIAGLKVIVPSTPDDLYGLMRAAILDDNPVVSFEARSLDNIESELDDEDHIVPIGKATVVRPGNDVSLIAIGAVLPKVLLAVDEVARDGLSVEVIDLRSIAPMDIEAIRQSVRRTGRLVIVDEAPAMCSASSEIAASVAEDGESLSALRSPIRRVTGAHVPIPYAAELEDEVLPTVGKIAVAIRETVTRE